MVAAEAYIIAVHASQTRFPLQVPQSLTMKHPFHVLKTPSAIEKRGIEGWRKTPPNFTIASPLPNSSWLGVRSSTPAEHKRPPSPRQIHGAGRNSPIRRPADRLFREGNSAVAPIIFKNQPCKPPCGFAVALFSVSLTKTQSFLQLNRIFRKMIDSPEYIRFKCGCVDKQ